MSEVAKTQAEFYRDQWAKYFESVSRNVRMNFTDMDFENAKERETIRDAVVEIERVCEAEITSLNEMTFE